MERAAELGYNINRGSNGIALPTTLAEARRTGLPLHNGKHLGKDAVESADALLYDELSSLQKKFDSGNLTDAQLLEEVGKVEGTMRKALTSNKVRLQNADPHVQQ